MRSLLSLRSCLSSPTPPARVARAAINQDEFTRYELLEPESHAFRITHEVTATQAGAQACFQHMRGGVLVGMKYGA